MKIRLVETEFLHADEQFDGETERTKLLAILRKRLERDAHQTVGKFWLHDT